MVEEALPRVSISFAEALQDGGDHAIAVFAPDAETRIDDDTTLADDPDTISVGVSFDEPGPHEIRWIVIADDGDEQRGEFTFEVSELVFAEPEAGTRTPPPATPTSDATSLPSDDEVDADDASSGGAGLIIALGVLALVALAVLIVFRRGRSPRT